MPLLPRPQSFRQGSCWCPQTCGCSILSYLLVSVVPMSVLGACPLLSRDHLPFLALHVLLLFIPGAPGGVCTAVSAPPHLLFESGFKPWLCRDHWQWFHTFWDLLNSGKTGLFLDTPPTPPPSFTFIVSIYPQNSSPKKVLLSKLKTQVQRGIFTCLVHTGGGVEASLFP